MFLCTVFVSGRGLLDQLAALAFDRSQDGTRFVSPTCRNGWTGWSR